MNWNCLLGLPLDEAVRRLDAQGVSPVVLISKSPRRPEGVGALRVVRVQEEGRLLTACAFQTEIEEAGA